MLNCQICVHLLFCWYFRMPFWTCDVTIAYLTSTSLHTTLSTSDWEQVPGKPPCSAREGGGATNSLYTSYLCGLPWLELLAQIATKLEGWKCCICQERLSTWDQQSPRSCGMFPPSISVMSYICRAKPTRCDYKLVSFLLFNNYSWRRQLLAHPAPVSREVATSMLLFVAHGCVSYLRR